MFPSLSRISFEVLPDRWWILAQFPIFSNLPFSRKSPTVIMLLLLFHLNFLPDLQWILCQIRKICIFVKPTIIDTPLFSSCLNFCQICHVYKVVICQDVPFCHLIYIWPNPWTVHFAEICRFHLNLPYSYYNRHLSRFPSLSPYLSLCQAFDGFLPKFANFANLWFS